MRTVFCRYEDCGKPDDVIGTDFKPTCPACGRDARWTTQPGRTIKERRKSPRTPYALTHNDRRLLKSLRIQTDEPPPPNNDDQADGA